MTPARPPHAMALPSAIHAQTGSDWSTDVSDPNPSAYCRATCNGLLQHSSMHGGVQPEPCSHLALYRYTPHTGSSRPPETAKTHPPTLTYTWCLSSKPLPSRTSGCFTHPHPHLTLTLAAQSLCQVAPRPARVLRGAQLPRPGHRPQHLLIQGAPVVLVPHTSQGSHIPQGGGSSGGCITCMCQ